MNLFPKWLREILCLDDVEITDWSKYVGKRVLAQHWEDAHAFAGILWSPPSEYIIMQTEKEYVRVYWLLGGSTSWMKFVELKLCTVLEASK